GVPILGEDADGYMWKGWKELTLMLPEGTYTVGVVVENIPVSHLAPEDNPGGLLYAAYGVDDDIPVELFHVSDENWDTFFTETDWPGWTPGQILHQIIDEAQTRGA